MYLSTSLSSVFSKNDVRLIGLKDLANVYVAFPGFGINTTLAVRHVVGIYAQARHVVKILQSHGRISSSPA